MKYALSFFKTFLQGRSCFMESFPQGKGSFGQYKLLVLWLALATRAHELGNTYTLALCLIAEKTFEFFGRQ
jgi:hypothetical protein